LRLVMPLPIFGTTQKSPAEPGRLITPIMYLMYVDESGDCGLTNSPTRYFVLSAIVIQESRWREMLQSLYDFRRALRDTKGLKLREEIHCTELINKPGSLKRIKRNDRLDIMKKCIDWLNDQKYARVFSVIVDKQGKNEDIFELAWKTLLTRFHNTIAYANFPDGAGFPHTGMLISDNTEGEKLRMLVRKLRHYNPIPNDRGLYNDGYRNIKLTRMIEDPVLRDSKYSFIHQINDVLAYCARQLVEPNSYMKRKGGTNFYKRLTNVHCTPVSGHSRMGIVRL